MDVNELIELLSKHLRHLHSGKVRESFRVYGPNGELWLLVLATDRRSIFDFKLGFTIPQIGEVLNATNIYFRGLLDDAGIKHDMVAYGAGIDQYLKEPLLGIPDLQKRALLVRELDMLPVECVARAYLTGSAWNQYKKAGLVCGQLLSEGLLDGSRLEPMLFTPTTKAEEGHDMPLPVDEVQRKYPDLEKDSLALFALVNSAIQKTKRFMWVDGKIEGGYDVETGVFRWGDEIGTFDSCRIWNAHEYETEWPPKLPSSYDKQVLRDWGKEFGINKLEPEDTSHRAHVYSLRAPESVITTSRTRAFDFFYTLTHYTYREFQKNVMGIVEKKGAP